MSYYKKNREKILLKKKEYQDENADTIKQYQRDYYLKNKEIKKQKVKQRYLSKKEEIIADQVFKRKLKRHNDSFFKMKHNIRSLVSMVLRNRSFSKDSKTAQLLGCSWDDFKVHIENQFNNEMTWENYGSMWTYDHICPVSQAQTKEELLKLQYFLNIRPYKDNLVKSDNKTPEGEQLCSLLLGRTWINKE